jgi:hypothetical protein
LIGAGSRRTCFGNPESRKYHATLSRVSPRTSAISTWVFPALRSLMILARNCSLAFGPGDMPQSYHDLEIERFYDGTTSIVSSINCARASNWTHEQTMLPIMMLRASVLSQKFAALKHEILRSQVLCLQHRKPRTYSTNLQFRTLEPTPGIVRELNRISALWPTTGLRSAAVTLRRPLFLESQTHCDLLETSLQCSRLLSVLGTRQTGPACYRS